MKTIKNTFLTILTVLLANALFVSCSSDEEKSKQNKNSIDSIDFDFFGIQHNKILNEFYKSTKPNQKKGFLINYLDQLIDSKMSEYRVKTPEKSLIQQRLNKTYITDINIYSSLYDGYENEISNQLKIVLDELDSLLLQQGIEHLDRIESIIRWENFVRDNDSLTYNEKYIALAGSSVARHSIEFWSQNISEVNNKILGDKSNTLKDGWFDDLWNYSVGCWKEDAKGAVITAVAVGVETGGLGAPMGIVGGGVANSALYHIDQLL